MKPLHQIIGKPLITEKTSLQKEIGQVVAFEVARNANKIEVKKVNTALMAGKVKRRGLVIGKRSNWKKAYVTLEEGSNIDFFGV
jgi:large subunit ribosomal protein L23